MTDDEKRRLTRWAEDVISGIRSNMESEGVNASGQTSASLGYELKDDGITIYGAPYFAERTEIGRTPTKNPMNFDFTAVIAKWIDDKGLRNHFGIEDDRDLKSVAYAIVRRITTEGSAKYRGDMPQTDVFSGVLAKATERIMEDMTVLFTERALGIIDSVARENGKAAGTVRWSKY